MRRTLAFVVMGVMQIGLFASLASAGVLDFSGDFDNFDTTGGLRVATTLDVATSTRTTSA